MLLSLSWQVLKHRTAFLTRTTLSRPRFYASLQKSLSNRPHYEGPEKRNRVKKVAIENTPRLRSQREKKRATPPSAKRTAQQGEVLEPEVKASNTRLLSIVYQTRIDLDAVQQVASDCQLLQQKDTILYSGIVEQLLRWCCRALVYSNRRLIRDKLLARDPDFQQTQATLRSLIDRFIAQYKQGRFKPKPEIPAYALRHYGEVGELDKALKLWNWLVSVKEKGHQGWRTYTARIAIADFLDEGYDTCKALYEEALDSIGDPLVKYHVSDNALLADPTQPAPEAAVSAIPLLEAMFSVRLKYGHWREAYLGLDTILRLDPTRLWRQGKPNVLALCTPWEAFLIECLEVHSSRFDGLGTKYSPVIPWLSQLVPTPAHQDAIPTRLYSVACTVLESLKIRYQARIIGSKGQQNDTSPWHKCDFDDLKLLWTCWSTLSRLNGGQPAQAQDDLSPTHEMADFIRWMLETLDCRDSQSFQTYMEHNSNALAKLKGNPEMQQTTSILLSKLRELIAEFKTFKDKADAITSQTIPYWSDLFSRDDMFTLYQEMGFNGQSKNQTALAEADRTTSSEDNQTSHVEFIYQTKTGLSFAEARFHSWWIINNLYLAADAFEQAGCLYRYRPTTGERTEAALKQAEALEALNLKDLPEEERKQKKHMFLDFIRDLRRHDGDSSV